MRHQSAVVSEQNYPARQSGHARRNGAGGAAGPASGGGKVGSGVKAEGKKGVRVAGGQEREEYLAVPH